MGVASQGTAKNAWAELMVEHGHSTSSCPHKSRHAVLDNVVDLTTTVADVWVTTAILDTMLDTRGSSMNFLGTEMPTGDGEGAAAAAGVATGILGSIFSA